MMADIARAVQALTADMRARVQLMAVRALILIVKDGGDGQVAQIKALADEDHDDAESMSHYGFTSVPLGGAECVVLRISGNADHGVVIATGDRRTRLKGLQGGEVALYTDEGDKIVLKRGNEIEVTTHKCTVNASVQAVVTSPLVKVIASTKVLLDTPLTETTGNLTVGGIFSALNGYTMGGALGGGAASTITGAISFNSVQIVATGGSTMSFNGKRIDDTLRVSGVQSGGSNSGTPI